jgi:hypothetical protein
MNAGPTTPATDSPATASRRRILARTRLDFWLDALLLVAYTLAYSLGFTGIATHEWLVNLLLLLSMTLCIASGILISEVALPKLGITGNLIRTCEIEAALAAVAITASVIARRRRRIRRTAAGA